MEGTIGEIRLFAANFAPRNWWYCDGTIIAIRSNTALFAILGTTYGGDGTTTFALPNLAGRSALGADQGPGLSYYELGQISGTNSVTLNTLNLPMHNHNYATSLVIPAYADEGDSGSPSGNILASKANMYSDQPADSKTKPAPFTMNLSPSGGNNPLSITQPSIGMNYIICLTGVFPARN